MKTRVMMSLFFAACCVALAAHAEQPPAPSGDAFQGAYEGVFHWTGRPDLPANGLIVAEGPGLYRVVASCVGDEGQVRQVELHGQLVGPRVLFRGYSGSGSWEAEAADNALKVTGPYNTWFELKKTDPHSPTEGQAPPEGAVVLLPFQPGVAPDMSAWNNTNWKAYEDGSMGVQPGTGANTTKAKIGDCKLHLEFYLPLMAGEFGQGRANSGVYIQNRYEVQVLDSFGVLPYTAGDCGGLYDLSAARVNACFPPEHWQTYDIDFRAPRFNDDGSQKEPARITVRHNGMLIQDNVAVAQPTPGGTEGPGTPEDVLHLQDHGNRTRFRNIWYVPVTE